MRKNILLFIISLGIVSVSFSQIGIGTNTPDTSAILEIKSSNKGLLPPRIALTASNVAAPVLNPAKFLLVCNIDSAGTSPFNVVPGYYYWTGTSWYPVLNKGNKPGDMEYWDGTEWLMIPAGTDGEVLTWCSGMPVWGGCIKTATFQPGPNAIDAYVFTTDGCNDAADGNNNPDSVLYSSAWTYNANGCSLGITRSLLKFAGLDSLPANAVITSAILSLYGSDSSSRFLNGDSYYPGSPYNTYGTNQLLVQRATSAWNQSTVTWNTQPTSTTQDQDTIPASTSRWDYNVTLDVTTLVNDMKATNNYGFLLQQVTEQIYRQMTFLSSNAAEPAKRPKLVITYKLQ